jgi:hypothetical protein
VRPMTTTHVPTLHSTNELSHHASCSCGWTSRGQNEPLLARYDWLVHLEAVQRAEAERS